MLSHIAFLISLLSVGAIFALCVASLSAYRFQFWPPPSKASWQHRLMIFLFRCFFYMLLGLTALQFELLTGQRAIVQYGIGGAMLITGFGLAFWVTCGMGWKNAFGEKLGLRTTGWFAWSRNPVYVVTWGGLVGWGLIANAAPVSLLLSLWAILYLAAPFLEEPWLEREYGDDYRAYKAKTPRFF